MNANLFSPKPPHGSATRRLAALALAAVLSWAARADYTESTNLTLNVPIPDGDPSGLAITRDFQFSITNITSLTVDLNIAGQFNGDIYGFLSHQSGYSVLLNRVGRTAANDLGYGDPGFQIKLSDSAANGDVHVYRSTLFGNNDTPLNGPLTGLWAPDGRNVDPSKVTDADSRTALLSSFKGLDPNGQWTLFLADVSPGATNGLASFGVEVTGVPEPGACALLAVGAAVLAGLARFRKANRR